MINDVQNIDTSNIDTSPAQVSPQANTHKQPILPYVLDFIKFVGGFTLIIVIALFIIKNIAVY